MGWDARACAPAAIAVFVGEVSRSLTEHPCANAAPILRGLARVVVLLVATASVSLADESPPGAYISTGDNHWLASSLPIDSADSIDASFEFLKRLGVRRVYWRGLQEAAWLETVSVREENCRYAGFWRWVRLLYSEVDPDRKAVEAVRRQGMEIWGVSALFDWGCGADAPCSGDYPHLGESRLRIEHPEWVPVDRRGILRQGGPIELAYPEARRALVDLHGRLMARCGYDGLLFMTYAENYSTRFQDEFGYNPPIVSEFKRRTGVDIATAPFTRTASRFDWYALRGEHVTAYLRELRKALPAAGRRLAIFVNPQQPNFPQPWNVPELMLTAGHIYLDLGSWAREGLVDRFVVYGYCHPDMQRRATKDCLWMVRDTSSRVGVLTSSPADKGWQPFQDQGAEIVSGLHDEGQYLERFGAPAASVEMLGAPDEMARLAALWRVAREKAKATVPEITPSLEHRNPLVRRAALLAIGKTKDPAAVVSIEKGLGDREGCVRAMAAQALRDVAGTQSAVRLLECVDRHGNHPLNEVAVVTLSRMRPAPLEELKAAARGHANPVVRQVAMRALSFLPRADLVPLYAAGLTDADRYVRFAAAQGLGGVRRCPEAAEALIAATRHGDPVVSDRAATSLAAIAERKEPEIDPLRERMVAALRDLYAKLGDGCARADADWGYRPVGNALLRFGVPGEKILREFMDQSRDRRLAEQAWRSLCVRQDNGRFSEVTEVENDKSYRQRPAWIDAAPIPSP